MFKFRFAHILIFLIGSIMFFSCSDDSNPVKDDDMDGDHAEAVGCVIFSDDVELARSEKGTVTGQLQVNAGEETPVLTIQFVAEDGDLFQPDEEASLLKFEFADNSIATITQIADYGKWKFNLHGIKAGTTEVTFKIMHGDHADFVAKPIPVEVTE
jgi:hypothetical protein